MKNYDVVIIGSGVSSLTCALLLKKYGLSVCILEQHYVPGGYLHCFNRFGTQFDTGAHYVGAIKKGQPFYALLNYLGIDTKDLFIDLDKECTDLLFFSDFDYKYSASYEDNIERLSEIFPSEKSAIKKYFKQIKDSAENFPTYFFNPEFDAQKLNNSLNISLKEIVDGLFNDPRLKCIIYSSCNSHRFFM